MIGFWSCFSSTHLHAAGDETWASLGLADLSKVEVESASRKKQALSDIAAAVFVITADDIKRSGALTLPEALRLAPGVEAARLSNNKWAVTIRGFNGRMANKLLVLMDGRTLYSSLYGGVLWENEDIPMEEIERIEVIRGSAGLAWGSNAVNGVINVITKRTQDTNGWLVDTHAGTSTGRAGGVLRYGAKMEDGSAFNVTVNDQVRDGGKELNGNDAQDQWNDTSLSFRYDRPEGASRRWFASGRIYDSESGDPWLIPTFNPALKYDPALYGNSQLVPFTSTNDGINLLGRLEQVTDGGGEVRIQAYVDQFKGVVAGVTDERSTIDLDGQHHFALNTRHDIVWGGNYRQNRHTETVNPQVGFLSVPQPNVEVNLSSIFAQDEWTIIPAKFNIQAGMRVEHQTYGGTSPQPSVKAMWTLDPQSSLWAGWSKTVRAPSVVEEMFGANPQAITTGPLPVLVHAYPASQSGFGNEKARTLELGYRSQWTPTLSADMTAYMSNYDGIFSNFSGQTMTANPAGTAATGGAIPTDPACAAALTQYGLPGGPGLCANINRGNALSVRTRGIELATEWRPLSVWRLQLNASRLWLDGGSVQNYPIIYGTSPHYQGSLRSSLDVSSSQRFDFWLRRIGGLSGYGNSVYPVAAAPIAARTELDLRYAVQVSKPLEISLTAQNLLAKQQLQFYPDYIPSLPVIPQRTVYLRAVWRNR
jgi:iron complex outermembrane receptor protein